MNTAATKISLSFPKKEGECLVFSLPQTNSYQAVSSFSFTPGRCRHKIYFAKSNRVVVFYLNDVEKKIKIDFQIKLKSYSLSIDKNYRITDYPKNIFPPNRFIDGQEPQIMKMAKQTVGKEQNLETVIRKLYDFTRNYLTYGRPTDGLYSYKQAMGERITDCGGFSTFLASLLASQNIPSRLVVGYIVQPNFFQKLFPQYLIVTTRYLRIHAWLELLLPNGSWFPVDASTGKFGTLPANRLVTSFGYDFNLKIGKKNYQIDLLQKPIYL